MFVFATIQAFRLLFHENQKFFPLSQHIRHAQCLFSKSGDEALAKIPTSSSLPRSDCLRSYFKSGADVQALLAHEQIHFDISEIYTRRFVQRISTEIESVKELEAEGQQILRAVYLEMEKQQTQYNNESISHAAR